MQVLSCIVLANGNDLPICLNKLSLSLIEFEFITRHLDRRSVGRPSFGLCCVCVCFFGRFW